MLYKCSILRHEKQPAPARQDMSNNGVAHILWRVNLDAMVSQITFQRFKHPRRVPAGMD